MVGLPRTLDIFNNRILMTAGVSAALGGADEAKAILFPFLKLASECDYGELSMADRMLNDRDVDNREGRILCRYTVKNAGSEIAIYITVEHYTSRELVTTVMLPEEY